MLLHAGAIGNDVMQIGPKIMPVPDVIQNFYFKILNYPVMQRLTTP